MDNEDLVTKNKLLEEENNALKEKYIILQNDFKRFQPLVSILKISFIR